MISFLKTVVTITIAIITLPITVGFNLLLTGKTGFDY